MDECSYKLKGEKVTFNPEILITDTNFGKYNGEKSWYSDPHHKFELIKSDGSIVNYTGTFRSPK